MPQSSAKKIITIRQLNFTLSPVDKHNHKEMPYALNNYEIDGTWNHHQSIILDVILDRLLNAFYAEYKGMPKSWRSEKVMRKIAAFSGGFITPETISYLSLSPEEAYAKHCGDGSNGDNSSANIERNDAYEKFIEEYKQKTTIFNHDSLFGIIRSKLFENYDILKKYRYDLNEHLRSISETRFKMDYKIKYMQRPFKFDDNGKRTDKGELIDLHYRMREFQHLFEVSFEDDNINLNFKTPLGKLVFHNMLILDTDWLPVAALELPKNAYFLYKRFVLNKISGRRKSKNIEISFSDAKSFLDLNWDNDRGVHGIIAKSLGHIVEKGLAEGLEWRGKPACRRIYALRFEKREEDQPVEPLKFSELSN